MRLIHQILQAVQYYYNYYKKTRGPSLQVASMANLMNLENVASSPNSSASNKAMIYKTRRGSPVCKQRMWQISTEVNSPNSSESNKAMQMRRQYDKNCNIASISSTFTTSECDMVCLVVKSDGSTRSTRK